MADVAIHPAPAAEPTQAPLTEARVGELLEAALSGYSTKINGELAKLRRGAKTDEPATPAAPAPAPAPAAVTMADLQAMREMGRLEATLGEDVMSALAEDLEGLPLVQQAAVLRAAAKVHRPVQPEPRDAEHSRGETPASTTRSARSAASAQRDAAPPKPRDVGEYMEQRKDPKRRAQLMADPSFDPSSLPA